MIVRVSPAKPAPVQAPVVDVVYIPEAPAQPARPEPAVRVLGIRVVAAHISPPIW